MAKQVPRRGRSPLVPISVNAFLGHAFNACIEPLDLDIQELDPGLLRFTHSLAGTTTSGRENILSSAQAAKLHNGAAEEQKLSLRKVTTTTANCTCSPPLVSPWSPEPVISPIGWNKRSSFSSTRNMTETAIGSLSPPSCFSAFSTPPMKMPRMKIPTYKPAELEEDVIVMDGIVITESNSFLTPEQVACPKPKSTSSETSATSSGVSPNSLYKTEIFRSWEDSGTCRYGLKCQFAHGINDLRPTPRHPKYKTEICQAFTATGACPYGTRCRFIHRLNLNNNNGHELNLPASVDELLDATNRSQCRSGNRTLGRRLPIFEQICPIVTFLSESFCSSAAPLWSFAA